MDFFKETWNGWLIFLIGYFHFYAAIILVLSIKKKSGRWLAVSAIYAVPILMNVVARVFLGWLY